VHLALSHVTPLPLVPLLSAALLVLLGTALVLRSRGSGRAGNSRGSNSRGSNSRGSNSRGSNSRGSNSGSGRSRHSGGPRVAARFAAAPDPRFAAHSRFAPAPRFGSSQGGHFAAQSITAAQPFVVAPHFAAAQSIAAAQPFVAAPHFAAAQSITAAQHFAAAPRLVPDPGDLFVTQTDLHVVSQPDLHLISQPDLHVVAQPDLRVVVTAPSGWVAPGPSVASVSVLAALTEGDKARPAFAPSNSGDAFPTRTRALSLLGAHVLAVLGIFTLSLAATPIGSHFSHVGGISVGSLALLCVFVGFAFAVVVAARVQHDIMGGGWYGGFAPRISYISPEVALYVISPSGISAAARRLNSSPARLILVEYGLLAAAVLIVLDRLVGR